jgi:hypothetical protein
LFYLCVANLFTLAFCRLPLPPPPPPGLAAVTMMAAVAGEVQELHMAREEELTQREEALATWEEKKWFPRMPLPRSVPTSMLSRPRMRPLEKSTMIRWWLIPPVPMSYPVSR